jgi:hypothetical protein
MFSAGHESIGNALPRIHGLGFDFGSLVRAETDVVHPV